MADRNKQTGLLDEVLAIRVHTKVTKGGRTLSFSALVAVGDGHGKVGLGYGKARAVPMAIEKANKEAQRNMVSIPLIGDTVCHEIQAEHKAAKVLIKPAAPGTGVKAGGTVRAIMNVLGVHNVLTKSLGNNNPLNLAKAAINALKQIRSVEEVEQMRQVRVLPRHPQFRRQVAAAHEAVDEAADAQQ
jgi:small subunit ribosomal protein S5